MLDSIRGKFLKKTLKVVAVTALDTVSMVLDKGAEYADEGKDYINSLEVKETSKRENRKENRTSDES